MKYGYFQDDSCEYVITTPHTPRPWINYLGHEDFISLISHTGGGYSFYRDPRYRRITRYRYNNRPADTGGRCFYFIEGERAWSPAFKPLKTPLDSYECRHGMGYTCISSVSDQIETDLLLFVPLKQSCEIQRLTVRNGSSRSRTLRLFSLTEFCLWDALDDMTNFQRNLSTGEVEVEDSVIYHVTEYRERRNHYAFYGVNAPLAGWDTDGDRFFGLEGGHENPEMIRRGSPGNSIAAGWSPVASHCIDLELAPGEERALIFVLGYMELEEERKWEAPGRINKAPAKKLMQRYAANEAVEDELRQLKEYWAGLLSCFNVTDVDPRAARSVNVWNQYQCMITFRLARSASYFESGIGRGVGFRDTCQDMLGVMHQIPDEARQRILTVGATQFEDGGSYHQYQPLTGRGNNEVGGNFNDDPLWLIFAVVAYIKETGRYDILDEQVPFDHDPAKADTLFEHLLRSFNHVTENLGPHGLPLIGRADWNDCLNLNAYSTDPDESFQTADYRDGGRAESLLIAGMFVFIGGDFAELCRRTNRKEQARRAERWIDRMRETVEKHGWDGEWFLRAWDDAGGKVGSAENAEGKIFIETQGFCSMAGIGMEKGLPQRALDSTSKHLACDYGIALHWPAFTRYYPNLGEISTYPPGYKENGGIFCHNNPWVMIAEALTGRGDRAFNYYSRIAPGYVQERSNIHGLEPYVYAQMIAGAEAVRCGEAKNSWLTGTAAWNCVAISQYILGIRPDFDGLKIDPCIPTEWEGFHVRRLYRESVLDITVENRAGVSRGVKQIIVDGEKIEGNTLPLLSSGEHTVRVVMG